MENEVRKYLTDKEKDVVGRKCCNCGSEINLMYHHIVPIAYGGNNVLSNFSCVCEICHSYIHHRGKKHFMDHAQLIKEGLEKAKKNGTFLGLKRGTKLTTKKSLIVKDIILKNSEDFDGTLKDKEIIKLCECSRNSYYKYKKILKIERSEN